MASTAPNRLWPSPAAGRLGLRRGTGAGVRVAILDSGVDTRHPALDGLRLRDDVTLEPGRKGWITRPGRGLDVYGHGTAVAGIIHRLAPKAELASIRVLGTRLDSRTALISAGARLALRRGYQILNCSFGCGRPDHVLFYKEWIDEAYLRGRHVVACGNNLDATRREWPGHFPTVLTATFMPSDRAELFWYQPGTLVEFAAPGVDVEVPWRDGALKRVSGSSFAAAHLTGLLARLLSVYPELHPLQAKTLMHRLGRSSVRRRIRGQRSEVRGQRSEGRGQRAEGSDR